MRARKRTAASDKRRRQILEAALACFLDRGVAATTTEEIRDRSGASIGSIYHHFGGKEQLAGSLHVEGLRDYQTGFRRELERHAKARAGIEAVVHYHLRWVAAHPDWARYLFHMREAEAVRVVAPEIRELSRELSAAVTAWVEPHVRSGVLAPLPPEIVGAVWIGPAQQLARHWLAAGPPDRRRLSRAARLLADAAWKSLRAAS